MARIAHACAEIASNAARKLVKYLHSFTISRIIGAFARAMLL